MKMFRMTRNVGKVRHLVSFHDGVKVHTDGSPFFDIQTFSRARDAQRFAKELKAAGYVERQ
jgi:hypothetical protein